MFYFSGDLKEVSGLMLSTGRGTGLIKYEISIPPPSSVVQVQQLDWAKDPDDVLAWLKK